METLPAKDTSRRSSDRLALALFEQIRDLQDDDQQQILNELIADDFEFSGPRAQLAIWALHRCADETGGPVSKRRYVSWRKSHPDKGSLPSATWITNSLARTWTKALDLAGMKPTGSHADYRLRALGRPLGADEVMDALKSCAAALGTDCFTERTYLAWAREETARGRPGIPMSSGPLQAQFGTFRKAMFASGLRPGSSKGFLGKGLDYTREKKIEILRLASEALRPAESLTQTWYVHWRTVQMEERRTAGDPDPIPSVRAIVDEFGTWAAALSAAEVVPKECEGLNARGRGQKFSAVHAARVLVAAATAAEPPMSHATYECWRRAELAAGRAHQIPAASTLARKFGGWSRVQAVLAKGYREADPIAHVSARLRQE